VVVVVVAVLLLPSLAPSLLPSSALQAKLKKGASADYILSKGFSTPLKKFEAIEITKGIVTIDGGGHTILDGRGTSSMFIIDGGTLIVKGVTLQNGHAKVSAREWRV
jgi:hypothetical protein